jgi:hypothetical protein
MATRFWLVCRSRQIAPLQFLQNFAARMRYRICNIRIDPILSIYVAVLSINRLAQIIAGKSRAQLSQRREIGSRQVLGYNINWRHYN